MQLRMKLARGRTFPLAEEESGVKSKTITS